MSNGVEQRLREIEAYAASKAEQPGKAYRPDDVPAERYVDDVRFLSALLREREEENRRLREALAAIRDYAAPRSDLSVYVEIMYEMASDAIRGEQP